MTGDELEALLADGTVHLVDVRVREEYEGTTGYPCDPVQGHIPGALHIELDEILGTERDALPALLAERGVEAGKPLVLYCHSGSRSGIAAAALNAAGIDAVNYPGSWHEWARRDGA